MAHRTNLNSLANLNNFAKMFNPETITQNVILSLANRGEDAIREAYESKNWFDQKGNLHDSFVSAVFLNGKLQEGTIRYVGEEIATSPKSYGGELVYGRDEANRFLIDYESSLTESSGITLIIASAMFYSSILENRGYRVISHVSYLLDDIKRKGISVNIGPWTTSMVKIDGSIMRTTNADDAWFKI